MGFSRVLFGEIPVRNRPEQFCRIRGQAFCLKDVSRNPLFYFPHRWPFQSVCWISCFFLPMAGRTGDHKGRHGTLKKILPPWIRCRAVKYFFCPNDGKKIQWGSKKNDFHTDTVLPRHQRRTCSETTFIGKKPDRLETSEKCLLFFEPTCSGHQRCSKD